MRSDNPDTLVWLPVSNAAGETIPAFAAMRVTGVDSDGVFTVAKPNADSAVTNIMFNGPVEIESGLYGHGTFGIPCSARYDTADGTPSNGDEWGVESGGWKLRNAKLGFKIQGSTDSSNGVATVVRNLDAAAAGGGLDISGRSGSIADVTAAQFLRTTISGTAGATVVTPDDASASLPGDVSTGVQEFAGAKTLLDFLTINDYLIVNGDRSGSSYAARVYGNIVAESQIDLLPNSTLPGTSTAYLSIAWSTLRSVIDHRINDGSVRDIQLTLYANDGTYGDAIRITSGTSQPHFVVGTSQGVTGTGGAGDGFTGGICTALGTGPTGSAGGDLGGTYPNPTVSQASGVFAFTGDISPSQLTANTDNWNPSGW